MSIGNRWLVVQMVVVFLAVAWGLEVLEFPWQSRAAVGAVAAFMWGASNPFETGQ